MTQTTAQITAQPTRSTLGLPILGLVGLAALGLPRVVLHDLHLIGATTPVTWLLALGPVVLWIVAVLAAKSPRPFRTVLTIGMVFGVMLVATHQLLWDSAFQGNVPTVGDGPAAALIPRLAAVPSGLIVGTALGAIGGLVARIIQAATQRSAR